MNRFLVAALLFLLGVLAGYRLHAWVSRPITWDAPGHKFVRGHWEQWTATSSKKNLPEIPTCLITCLPGPLGPDNGTESIPEVQKS